MSSLLITDQVEFEDLCLEIRQAGEVGFDTEFVSDTSYRPHLCLLQFAVGDRCVAVDPLHVHDLGSWWSIMADRKTRVVVHAAREEVRFCLRLGGVRPHRLVDVQVAEGLRSRAYPLSYQNLVARVLGKRLSGKETRSDWTRRPLSDSQLRYALEDVRYVLPVWHAQQRELEQMRRTHWAESEFERLVNEVVDEFGPDSWRRVAGIHRLEPRELAVARELVRWREATAERLDRPARRLLRDDLLVELARRRPRTSREVLATRGVRQAGLRKYAHQIVECVERAEAIPEAELPERAERQTARGHEEMLARLLALALAQRCEQLQVSMTLVATNDDLVQFIRWHSAGRTGPTPRLCEGWRREVCGDLLTDILEGRVRLRVGDPQSKQPLVFEPADASASDRPLPAR